MWTDVVAAAAACRATPAGIKFPRNIGGARRRGCGPARCGRRLLPSPPPITSLIAAVAASSRRGHDGGGGTGYVRTRESLSGVGLASARQMASRRRVGLPALI